LGLGILPRPFAYIAASSQKANPNFQGALQREKMRDSTAGNNLICPKPEVEAAGHKAISIT
jgi:hypothetical protein